MSSVSAETIRWEGDASTGHINLIDQTLLPTQMVRIDCKDIETVWEAIKKLRVRGAPATGIAAAYGVVVGAQKFAAEDVDRFQKEVGMVADYLATSRPTAANLFWALDRMRKVADANQDQPNNEVLSALLTEAIAIHEEDRKMCHSIGLLVAK